MRNFVSEFTVSGAGIPVAELYTLWQLFGDRELTAGEFKAAVKGAGYSVGLLPLGERRAQHYLDLAVNEDAVASRAKDARANKHPLAKCEACPLRDAAYVATHNPNARTMFVGEKPGPTEARAGLPLAGQGLRMLEQSSDAVAPGLTDDAGITNLVACVGDASNQAVACCAERLDAETRDAKLVVAMGTAPARAFTDTTLPINELRARGRVKRGEQIVLPTYAPWSVVFAARNRPRFRADLSKAHQPMRPWREPRYYVPRDEAHAVAMLEGLRDSGNGVLGIDIETAGAPVVPGKQLGVLITKPERMRCIGLTDREDDVLVLGEDALRSATVKLVLNQVLTRRKLLAHNGKFDLQVLEHLGYGPLTLAADTMLAGYALDESKGGKALESMSMLYLSAPAWKQMLDNPDGDDWTYDNVPQSVLYEYNAKDVANMVRLWGVVQPLLAEQDLLGLHALLCRASDMLGRAERAGLRLDYDEHARLLRKLESERSAALEALRAVVGRDDFNPGSHIQVKDALAQVLGYRPDSSDKRTLQRMQNEGTALEVVNPLLEFRKVDKLMGTYIGPLREIALDGRIHANFNLIRTDTGRLSSSDPNLQNIPKPMRGLFIPDEGNVFVDTDIAQAELRVLAVESGDEGLAQVFRDGADVHGEVAAQLYGAGYTDEQRRKAKSVVFGLAYGRTAYGMAADPSLGMSKDESQELINAYFARFPRVLGWQRSIKRAVKRGEALRTKFGRVYRGSEAGAFTRDKYQLGELVRAAQSFIPQSTASDICLLAACLLSEQGAGVRALVHDAIVLECAESDAERWAQATRDALLTAGEEYTTLVPFVSDTDITHRWGVKE